MAKGAPTYKLALPKEPLRVSASPILMVRWHEMMAWAESVRDPKNVVELHNMRIAAKRLRYTLELFLPTLGGHDGESVLRSVEEIQERLGLIHDCDVLFPLLLATLGREMKREKKLLLHKNSAPPPFLAAEGLVALMTRKREEREQRYHEFLGWWDGLPPTELEARLGRVVGADRPEEPNIRTRKTAKDKPNANA